MCSQKVMAINKQVHCPSLAKLAQSLYCSQLHLTFWAVRGGWAQLCSFEFQFLKPTSPDHCSGWLSNQIETFCASVQSGVKKTHPLHYIATCYILLSKFIKGASQVEMRPEQTPWVVRPSCHFCQSATGSVQHPPGAWGLVVPCWGHATARAGSEDSTYCWLLRRYVRLHDYRILRVISHYKSYSMINLGCLNLLSSQAVMQNPGEPKDWTLDAGCKFFWTSSSNLECVSPRTRCDPTWGD